MKLRITKGRVACAVVLLPVLYVLNFGPLLFFCELFGLRKHWVYSFYKPLRNATNQTPLAPMIIWYIHLWVRSDTEVDFAYGWRWEKLPAQE